MSETLPVALYCVCCAVSVVAMVLLAHDLANACRLSWLTNPAILRALRGTNAHSRWGVFVYRLIIVGCFYVAIIGTMLRAAYVAYGQVSLEVFDLVRMCGFAFAGLMIMALRPVRTIVRYVQWLEKLALEGSATSAELPSGDCRKACEAHEVLRSGFIQDQPAKTEAPVITAPTNGMAKTLRASASMASVAGAVVVQGS